MVREKLTRQAISSLVMLAGLSIMLFSALLYGGQHTSITRLDGSTMTAAEVDATVMRLMKAAEVPGAAIAVLNDGSVVYQKAYGYRDTAKKLPLTVDSVMYAASFTKVAFAYMVMQLVDRGVLDLDKPVYQYLPKPLPEYPNYAGLANDPRYQKITARMLLSHTSGFANLRFLEEGHVLRIHFEPGSRFAYSGEGLILLQLIVETITHQSLPELMQENVFEPFGMTRTGMIWKKIFESDVADGYDEYGRPMDPERRRQADAAGSMVTTVADFARFLQAVMAGKRLSRKTWEQMLSSQIQITSKHEFPSLAYEPTGDNKTIRLSYGLGWGLYWSPYGRAFFKEGHADGWRNYTVAFDHKKIAIVIMTNSANGEGIFEEILETVLKDTFTPIEWEGYTPYSKLPPRPPLKVHKQVKVDPAILQRCVGKYLVPPETAPNVILIVRWEGDHLTVQENDEPKQVLNPASPTDFFTIADDEYTFETDAQGKVTRMILHADGHDIPTSLVK